MKNMKNWKTTIFGSIGAICTALIPVLPQHKEVLATGAAIGGILFAAFSKDNNVTGGTTQQ